MRARASDSEWLSAGIRNHTRLFFFERVSLPVTAFPARFTSLELVVVRTFACIVAHTARSSKIRCDCCSLHYESSSYAARYTASLGEFSSYAVRFSSLSHVVTRFSTLSLRLVAYHRPLSMCCISARRCRTSWLAAVRTKHELNQGNTQ